MELPARPTPKMLKFVVSRLEDDLQEFLVAERSSNIFRRAPTFTSEAKRRRGGGSGGDDLLQGNLMPPIVAKIVHVNHRVAFGPEHLADRNLALVNDLDIVLKLPVLRITPILAVLLELVKVAVGPPHHGLNGVMETAEWHCARHLGFAAKSGVRFRAG